ncbi:MAG: hypothetical protein ACI9UT_002312, partial [Flavobacteriales bacterium]
FSTKHEWLFCGTKFDEALRQFTGNAVSKVNYPNA